MSDAPKPHEGARGRARELAFALLGAVPTAVIVSRGGHAEWEANDGHAR